ncbi:MAG: pilin [bacterium]
MTLVEKIVAVGFGITVVAVTVPAIIAFTGIPKGIEAHTLMKPVQMAVTKHLQQTGQCPAGDLAALGITETSSESVAKIELNDNCVITATYRDDTREKLAGKTLAMYAGADAEGNIEWGCGTAPQPDLGANPRIPFAAGPEATTQTYAPWLPRNCHPPRSMDERKPALVVWLNGGDFDADLRK